MWQAYPRVILLQCDDVSRIICPQEIISVQSIKQTTIPPFSLLRLVDSENLDLLSREVYHYNLCIGNCHH